MNSVVILLDDLDDWGPYCKTNSLLTTSDYLQVKSFGKDSVLVINLSGDYTHNSEGYYCSLLAQARGHKVLPSSGTINKLGNEPLLRMSNGLQKLCLQWTQKNNIPEGAGWHFNIYFGQCAEKGLERIARFIFDNYPAPILRVKMANGQSIQMETIKSIPLHGLSDSEQDCFASALDAFNKKIWRAPRPAKHTRYSLAILHNPNEKLPPSNKKALQRFLDIAKKMDINAELVTEEDSLRLMEFDALFIRTTTSLHHYTFWLAQKAHQNGLIVIDDPTSIIRCTNKVYLNELLEKAKVPVPASRLIFRNNTHSFTELAQEFGEPFVVKIPDGSSSFGVHKACSAKEFDEIADSLFAKSAIALIQEYIPTAFDWRIGILNGEALFACKYHMATGHWQIFNHARKGKGNAYEGRVEALPLYHVPPKVLKTALKAAGLIGKGLYGVDLKEINGKVVVMEVNDNPNIDYKKEDAMLGDELYYRILNYFMRSLELQSR
jgi:glutathione synthase/RimK-type ligase-like ATP-grasp enzyme